MMSQAPRYCLYARKSSEPSDRQAMSIESQLNEMRSLASREGLCVVETKTESHSAKASGERPVFNGVIADLRARKYNAILTWAPDRLSRNAGDLGVLVDIMDQDLLVEIRTCNQTFTCSPNDKFLLMILCSQAKLENDNKGINVLRGMRARVESGRWPGVAPIGYVNSAIKGREGLVEPDPERAPIIRQVFEKVVDHGWSGTQVHHWLRQIGFKTRTGTDLPYSSVYALLRRSFYYGRFEWPKGSGKWHQGLHEPLIDYETFELTQKHLNERVPEKKPDREPVKSLPLARLMRCGHCTSRLTAQEKTKILASGKTVRYVYYCCNRGRNRQCKAPMVNEKKLAQQLADIMDRIDIDEIGVRHRLAKEIDDFYAIYTKIPDAERTPERRERELRMWAKTLLLNGKFGERLAIMESIKSGFVVRDGKVGLTGVMERIA